LKMCPVTVTRIYATKFVWWFHSERE